MGLTVAELEQEVVSQGASQIGLLAEVADARGTARTLGAHLDVALNPDGTLRSPVATVSFVTEMAPIISYPPTGTYVALEGDLTAVYVAKRRLRINGALLPYVTSSTYDAGGNYTIVNFSTPVGNSITSVEYSFDPAAMPPIHYSGNPDIEQVASGISTLATKHLSDVQYKSLLDDIIARVTITSLASVDDGAGVDLVGRAFKYVDTIDNLRTLTPTDAPVYIQGHTIIDDGGQGTFRWDASSTAADDNGVTIAVTGVAIGRWVRQLNGFVTPGMFGGTGDGSDHTTIFQAMIDTYPDDTGRYEIDIHRGAYVITALDAGSRTIVWNLAAGVRVTQGTLPGTVIRPKEFSISTPESKWVFGETPYTFPDVSVTSAANVGPGASSGNITGVCNGLSSIDRLFVSPRISTFTDGLLPYAYDPSGRNTFAVRFWNPTAANKVIGTRTFHVVVAKNSGYRQVFALSKSQGKDCVLAGVDMEGTKSATIFKTNNAGSSWKPMFSLPANSIRDIFTITDNTNSSANDTLNSVLIAPVSDPSTETELAWRSIDGGETWTAITFTLSGGDAENLIYALDVEGGEGSGGSRVIAVAGRAPGVDCTAYVSTDSGASFGSPIVIDSGSGYDGAWSVLYVSGSGATSVWRAFLHQENAATKLPAVYQSTDGGSTWSLLSTIGAAGDEWQGVCRLADGTLLASIFGTTNSLFRSTDNGATWANVLSPATFAPAETKIRVIKQMPNGTVIAAGQDSGYVWISRDNGLTWFRSQRIGGQAAPISMSLTDNWILFGCGQGFATSTGSRAEVYRSLVDHFNDSE